MDRPWLRLASISVLLTSCFESGVDLPAGTGTEGTTGGSTTGTVTPPGDSTTTAGSTTTEGPSSSSTAALDSSSEAPGRPAAATDDEYFWVQGPAVLEVDAVEGLLVNDTPDRGILLVTSDVQSARGGTISTEPGGGFTYEAPSGFWGVDSFDYTIEDGRRQPVDGDGHDPRAPRARAGRRAAHPRGGVHHAGARPRPSCRSNVDGLLGGDLRSVGDWDGDGVDDLGVVANFTALYSEGSVGSDNEGPVYVVLGGEYSGDPDPSDLENNQGGFAVQGPITSNSDPATVVGGDWNGDGLRDLAITAPFANLLGAAYVVYGDQGTTSFSLAAWGLRQPGLHDQLVLSPVRGHRGHDRRRAGRAGVQRL